MAARRWPIDWNQKEVMMGENMIPITYHPQNRVAKVKALTGFRAVKLKMGSKANLVGFDHG